MWLTFWITVGWGAFVMVLEKLLRVDMPWLAYVSVAIVGITGNGLEEALRVEYPEKCLPPNPFFPDLERCGPDYTNPRLEFSIEDMFLGSLIDTAAGFGAALVAWLFLKPFTDDPVDEMPGP